MPYVPTLDRPAIDYAVEQAAVDLCYRIAENFDVLKAYKDIFCEVAFGLRDLSFGLSAPMAPYLVRVISEAGKQYGYQGAFLGELNYAITRLIQRVPQLMVKSGKWQAKDELRYWLYAVTVEALIFTAQQMVTEGTGIAGVFEDIKDEYKRRVNTAYEAAQIVKSGDCYDTPYYNRLMKIVDKEGNEIGKILVDMPRTEATLHTDVIEAKLTAN